MVPNLFVRTRAPEECARGVEGREKEHESRARNANAEIHGKQRREPRQVRWIRGQGGRREQKIVRQELHLLKKVQMWSLGVQLEESTKPRLKLKELEVQTRSQAASRSIGVLSFHVCAQYPMQYPMHHLTLR